ncbi:MAG: hypothetical protein ACI4TK_10910 [Agathobacter sp.]
MEHIEYMEKTKDVVSFLKKCFEGDTYLQNDVIISQAMHDTKNLIGFLDSITKCIEKWKEELNGIKDNENGRY